MILLILLYSTIISYVIFILILSHGFKKVSSFTATKVTHKNEFSIIIPFRNEEAHLPVLLESLRHCSYPTTLYEVLLINDSSQDDSVTVITSFIKKHQLQNIKIIDSIRISTSPKKDAIQTAIGLAKHAWIVTTDADCSVPTLWLTTLDVFIQTNDTKFIAGPVTLPQHASSFLNAFEHIDTLSLMGATIGSYGIRHPFLCNGAHLVYDKTTFTELGGFDGNAHIASGDDHFILEKFNAAYPDQVHYLKSQEAIITTTLHKDWGSFIRQRKRWASKATGYTDVFTKGIGLLVLLTNLAMMVGVVFAFAKADSETFPLYIIILLIKVLVDGVLIAQSAQFFNKLKLLVWYPICAICYPFISTYIAIASLKGGFIWKGRYFKR
ncbi:glycosyltransferase [Dokdonia sp.]|uniref:glycosyltransferase n=1 Tax=Dokdonia sp. TaxID=2024995 RepID=UPI0032634082